MDRIGNDVSIVTATAVKAARYWFDHRGEPKPPTTKETAELFGVCPSAVERARTVLQQGTAELIEATEKGVLPLATAKRLAGRTPAEQRRILNEVTRGKSIKMVFPRDRPVTVQPLTGLHKAAREYVTIMGIEHLEFILTGLDSTLNASPGGLEPAITPEVAREHIRRIVRGRLSIKKLLDMLHERSSEDDVQPTPRAAENPRARADG